MMLRKEKNMKKHKIRACSFVICLVFIFSVVPLNVFADASSNTNTCYDDLGNKITTVTTNSTRTFTVEIYINDVLDHIVTTNKATNVAELKRYGSGTTSRNASIDVDYLDLSEYFTEIEMNVDGNSGISPAATLYPTTSYSIKHRIMTDYDYEGNVLYADCETRAHERGVAYRYNGHIFTISAGTLVGVAVSALIAALQTPQAFFTVTTLISIGAPVQAGVIIDYFTSTVCYTQYQVYTNVYINGVHVVYGYKIYDHVLASLQAPDKIVFSDDYYGYNIIYSRASELAGYAANRFNEKYISCSNPNLQLPVSYLN